MMQLAAQQSALPIDADQVVHEILNNDVTVQQAVAGVFGPSVLLEDGRINRPNLGKVVFNNPPALRQLEGIVHPAVYVAVTKIVTETKAKIIVYEAIKLLESKFREHCHQIWVTTCTREKQLERLQKLRGMDKQAALSRINAQVPQEEKIAQADVIIDTNGSMAATESQFEQAWSQLKILLDD